MNSSFKRRSGWWYPYIFVAAFCVVLAVNLVMAYSAVHTFSGIETDQAYEKGLKYNQTLAMADAQDKLGWSVKAELQPSSGTHGGALEISYRDRDGRPVTGLAVQAEFVRPTVAGHDAAVPLVEQGEGRYGTAIALALPGQWDMHVTAHRGDLSYQTDQRIYVP
jgi:nitrogen fixation protein FixH